MEEPRLIAVGKIFRTHGVKGAVKVLPYGESRIEVFEYPGYVTTRTILPFLNEAMHVVMEGVASAEAVDTSMKLGYGLPIGPLALADRMGSTR